ncbi:hypothetical protein ACFWZ2_07680 [Streptomyces sp. NPDC059002]|uniref:hypothetical protein n=1 Tax=Streptomyces sp. NPDC059002 TaxID=3346690 RepID=UPI003675246F
MSSEEKPGEVGCTGTEEEGGEAPCALNRVCPECGRLSGTAGARHCDRCGGELPESAGY